MSPKGTPLGAGWLPLVVMTLALLPAFVLGTGGHGIRGLEPKLAPMYDAGRDFTCLDGSETIPFKYVNDDYCDCADGSDEPGTSACPNGNGFYCRNKGHQSAVILSSRVNDGICDCCDGTDEWINGGGGCQDVCMEMGAEARALREKERAAAEQGYALRQQMVQEAQTMLQETKESIAAKEEEVEERRKEVEMRRAEKEAAEAPEKEALDKYRAEEERLKQEKEEQERQKSEAEALEFFRKLDENNDGKLTPDELAAEPKFDTDNDGVVGQTETDFYMAGNEHYQEDNFLSQGWPLMKHLIKGKNVRKPRRPHRQRDPNAPKAWNEAGQEVDEEGVPINNPEVIDHHDDDDEDEDEDDDEYDDYDEEAGDNDLEEESVDIDGEAVPAVPEADQEEEAVAAPKDEGGKKYDDETQALIDIADKCRRTYDEASNRLRDLERELRDLKDVSEGDYGDENEFLPMKGKCFEFTNNEYVYKMCPFDRCSQRGVNGGGETRLGSWDRWEGGADSAFSRMKFSNGQTCWNGPARSTLVKLVCGTESVIESVTEPNRCEYEMVFATPVICKSPEHYQEDPSAHDEL